MSCVRTKLKLSPQKQTRLRQRLASATKRSDRARLKVLLRAASGRYTLGEIAAHVGCARSTIQLWLERFKQGALASLLERESPPGQQSKITRPEVMAEIRKGIKTRCLRSLNEVAAWLAKRHAILMKPKSVGYQLRKLGFELPSARHPDVKGKPRPRKRTLAPVAAERREYKKDPQLILAHDQGALDASLLQRRNGYGYDLADLEAEVLPSAAQIALDEIYDLLEKERVTLDVANEFVAALKAKWECARLATGQGS